MTCKELLLIAVVGFISGMLFAHITTRIIKWILDDGKPPTVTYNADGSISIDQIDPGETVDLGVVIIPPDPQEHLTTEREKEAL